MKKNKVLKSIMAIAMVLTMLIPINANAQTFKTEGIEVNLGEFSYVIPDYMEDEVIVEEIAENSVNIIDKETGVILETITSTIISKDSPQLKSIISPENIETQNTSYYTIQRDKKDNLVTVRLEVVVVLYRSGSFSSIQSIEGRKMFPISSSMATLEDDSTYVRSTSGTYPTTHIEYLGSGVITIATSITYGDELSVGFSIPEVMEFGYSVNKSSGNTVYLRKPITIQGDFYTYTR